MVLLLNVLVLNIVKQVLHLILPELLLPREVHVQAENDRSALTSRSLRFFGHWKATLEGV